MKKTLPIALIFILNSVFLQAQSDFRVMSYNVENLFDTVNDPEKADEEFLPNGNRRWTNSRYYHKLQQIAKVINAAGEWSTPALVGLCEIENDSVLIHLLNKTPLKNQHYRFCTTDRSDGRGIRVALLYQRDKFGYINHASIPISHPSKEERSLRPILHIWGKVATLDTLDVIVCHFPSRYGGEKESEKRRMDAAKTVHLLCDSLLQARSYPQIIMLGDFNDEPDDTSMKQIESEHFCNLFSKKNKRAMPGTHKYQGEWSQLDQLIVSRNLVDTTSRMHVIEKSTQIFAPSFLLIKDKTWRGLRPKRTYYGFKYEGGYSDHLPVMADFLLHLH